MRISVPQGSCYITGARCPTSASVTSGNQMPLPCGSVPPPEPAADEAQFGG